MQGILSTRYNTFSSCNCVHARNVRNVVNKICYSVRRSVPPSLVIFLPQFFGYLRTFGGALEALKVPPG